MSGDRVFWLALAVGYPLDLVGLYLNGYQIRGLGVIWIPLIIYLRWPKKRAEPTARELDQWSSEDEAKFKRLANQRRK